MTAWTAKSATVTGDASGLETVSDAAKEFWSLRARADARATEVTAAERSGVYLEGEGEPMVGVGQGELGVVGEEEDVKTVVWRVRERL